MASAVEISGVGKRFGAVIALDGVSFAIAGGETVALLGPSGCGKTTLLRVIAGFERPDSGLLRIGGEEMTDRRPYERNVGLLFQHYALFPHMTVERNVGYGLRYRGFPRSQVPARVAAMLALVKLADHGERYPGRLSGGQQQRVALARALATSPGVLLLDEPLSALDAKLRLELRAELKDVLAAAGATVIVVTHDHEEAMSLGKRVFVMNRGRIVQSGAPDEIYARPASRFVAEFMGHGNWFAGRAVGDQRFATDCGRILRIAGTPPPGGCEVCLRPESIDLLPPAAEPGPNALAGRVLDVVPSGATRQVIVDLEGGRRLLVLQQNRAGPMLVPGAPVIACFSPEACLLVPADPE